MGHPPCDIYLLAQFVHLREVPDGGASQGGRVLHQDHLALVLVHGDHLAAEGLGLDAVEGHVCVRRVAARDWRLYTGRDPLEQVR